MNAMPKIVRVNLKEVNQHESVLGPDTRENERLTEFELRMKYRLCEKLFNAVSGRGEIE